MKDWLLRYRRWIVAGVAGVALIGGLLWGLPVGVREGAEWWLEKRGVTAQIRDVDLNLFTGIATLHEATGANAAGDGFRIRMAEAELRWRSLFSGRIHLLRAELHDAKLDIRQDEQRLLSVLGLDPAALAGDSDEKDEGSGPDFGLDRLVLSEVLLHWVSPQLSQDLLLDTGGALDFASWAPAEPTEIDIKAGIAGGEIAITGTLRPFASRFEADLRVRADSVQPGVFLPLLDIAVLEDFSGSLDMDMAANIRPDQIVAEGRLALTGNRAAFLLPAAETGDDGQQGGSEPARLEQALAEYDGKVEVNLPGSTPMTLQGDGRLSFRDSSYSQGEADAPGLSVGAGSAAWQGQWSVALADNGMQLKLAGGVEAEGLNWLLPPDGIKGNLEKLHWQGDADVTSQASLTYSANGELGLSGLHTVLAEQQLAINQGSATWQGELKSREGSAVPDLAGVLRAAATQIVEQRIGRDLLRLDGLAVEQLQVNGAEQIKAASLSLTGLAALQREAGGDDGKEGAAAHVVQAASAEVGELALEQLQRLTLASLSVDGLNAWLLRNKGGEFEFREWLNRPSGDNEAAEAPPESEEPQPTQPETPFSWAVGQINVGGDSRIHFEDHSVSPRFAEDIKAVSLQLGGLDSNMPDQTTPLDLKAAIGKRGSLTLAGPMQPLLPRPSFDLKGKLQAVDLSSLSPYSVQAIGYGVRQGAMNADVHLLSTAGKLDSVAKLKLSKVKLERTASAEGVDSGLGMPLNQALGLLRDREDNITLELPITGDIESPEFSAGDAIRQAVMKAVQFAVINFYSPLGVVFAADKLIDLATAVRFDPVEFSPGQRALDEADRGYLQKLSTLMADRPGVEIVVCGFSVPADRGARLSKIEEEKTWLEKFRDSNDRRPPEEKLTDEDLVELAGKRADAVADFLIEQGMDRSRLVSCAPKLDSGADAAPRVEFGF